MALLFSDSMDSYATLADMINSGRYGATPTGCYLNTTGGVFGGNNVFVSTFGQTGSGFVTRNIGLNASNTLYFGFWMASSNYPITPVPGTGGLVLPTSVAPNASLITMYGQAPNNGAICLQKLGSATVLATGTANIGDGRWHWVEVGINLTTAATGWCKVYVDNLLQINYTGPTLSATATLLGACVLDSCQHSTSDGNLIATSWDDVIIYDSTGTNADFNGTNFPLGPRRIVLLSPDADGDTLQFTPLSGTSHYAMVNGKYTSTNYVSDSNAGNGDMDLYKFPALPYTPSKVNAVVGSIWGQNAGVGSANITPQLKTSGTLLAGTPQALPSSVNYLYSQTYLTDASGNPWTAASVNALQFGMSD